MLHQVLPHVHHQHDGFDTSIEQSDHHHEQDHNHDHNHYNGEDDDSGNDFLGFLLGNHAHNYHSYDFTEVRNIAKQHIKVKDFSFYTLPDLLIFQTDDYGAHIPVFIHPPPDINYNTYLSARTLRGPPALG